MKSGDDDGQEPLDAQNVQSSSRPTALELVLEVIPHIRIIVDKIRKHDPHLADQLKRAVNTVALNLAEADGNRAGNRRMRLETAHGSTHEAIYAMRIAAAWGYVTDAELAHPISTFDRVGAMTWRRMQSQ